MKQVLYVTHIASGEAAIAKKVERGLILVQFNTFTHPHSHDWYLYPRHHFRRRNAKNNGRWFTP